jgi:hypothetical protein
MINASALLAQVKNCPEGLTGSRDGCLTTLPEVAANDVTLKLILQIALMGIAAATLIFIILTAIRLITGQGEAQSVAKARQSLIFAGVGLAIIFAAEVIVTLVIKVS